MGDDLLDGASTLAGFELDVFVLEWKEKVVAQLTTDTPGWNQAMHRRIAATLMKNKMFPSIDVLLWYARPITNPNIPLSFAKSNKIPDLSGLAVFCATFFEWEDSTIFTKFQKLVWPGAALQKMINTIIEQENIPIEEFGTARSGALVDRDCIEKIYGCKNRASTGSELSSSPSSNGDTELLRVQLNCTEYAYKTLDGLRSLSDGDSDVGEPGEHQKVCIKQWYHGMVIRHYVPWLVQEFEAKTSGSSKRGVWSKIVIDDS